MSQQSFRVLPVTVIQEPVLSQNLFEPWMEGRMVLFRCLWFHRRGCCGIRWVLRLWRFETCSFGFSHRFWVIFWFSPALSLRCWGYWWCIWWYRRSNDSFCNWFFRLNWFVWNSCSTFFRCFTVQLVNRRFGSVGLIANSCSKFWCCCHPVQHKGRWRPNRAWSLRIFEGWWCLSFFKNAT